jgi:hypothetical protein
MMNTGQLWLNKPFVVIGTSPNGFCILDRVLSVHLSTKSMITKMSVRSSLFHAHDAHQYAAQSTQQTKLLAPDTLAARIRSIRLGQPREGQDTETFKGMVATKDLVKNSLEMCNAIDGCCNEEKINVRSGWQFFIPPYTGYKNYQEVPNLSTVGLDESQLRENSEKGTICALNRRNENGHLYIEVWYAELDCRVHETLRYIKKICNAITFYSIMASRTDFESNNGLWKTAVLKLQFAKLLSLTSYAEVRLKEDIKWYDMKQRAIIVHLFTWTGTNAHEEEINALLKQEPALDYEKERNEKKLDPWVIYLTDAYARYQEDEYLPRHSVPEIRKQKRFMTNMKQCDECYKNFAVKLRNILQRWGFFSKKDGKPQEKGGKFAEWSKQVAENELKPTIQQYFASSSKSLLPKDVQSGWQLPTDVVDLRKICEEYEAAIETAQKKRYNCFHQTILESWAKDDSRNKNKKRRR